jgi:hypothetical protein
MYVIKWEVQMFSGGKLKVQGGMQLKCRNSSNEVTEVHMYMYN